MNPLLVLSLSCFLVAACLFVYWLHDLAKLRCGLREDQEYDRQPPRKQPDWMRRKTSRNRP